MFNIDAEAGLLGILLTNNRAYDSFSDILRPEHFYQPQYGAMFAYMQAEIEAGRKVSLVTMVGKIDGVDKEHMVSLLDAFIHDDMARHYAEIIVDMYQRRGLAQIGKEAQDMAKTEKSDSIFAHIEKGMLDITQAQADDGTDCFDAAGEAFQWMEDVVTGKLTAIRTGFEEIDKIIGGLFGGRLYILGGRPGMGKTALSLNIADNISKETPALVLSLEMTRVELAMRMMAMRTGIGTDRQQRPQSLSENDWHRLTEARGKMKDGKLIIHDSGKVDLIQIKTWARRFRRTKGRFVLVIDYLGLMSFDPHIQNKVHQIEAVTTGLKSLAKELDIPIILLCQLSRSLELRDDKRPTLADLRDSGSIEQDADCVLFCYREEYYLGRETVTRTSKMKEVDYYNALNALEDRKKAVEGVCEVIVAKNRQGRGGTAKLKFDGQYQKFFDKEKTLL
jgi:replicative DNA helicase